MGHLKRIGVFAFCALMTLSTRAEATPITGSGTFEGVIAITDLMATNSIDVSELAVISGAQLGLSDGGGYNPLWSFGSVETESEFNLLNFPSIERPLNGFLINVTWGDNTATGSFSGEKSGTFAFSSTTTATAVPDPGQTGVLLGMAVVGLAMVRRRVGGNL